jgi:hypothetical protein
MLMSTTLRTPRMREGRWEKYQPADPARTTPTTVTAVISLDRDVLKAEGLDALLGILALGRAQVRVRLAIRALDGCVDQWAKATPTCGLAGTELGPNTHHEHCGSHGSYRKLGNSTIHALLHIRRSG